MLCRFEMHFKMKMQMRFEMHFEMKMHFEDEVRKNKDAFRDEDAF